VARNAVNKYVVPIAIGFVFAYIVKKAIRMNGQLTKSFNISEFQSKDGATMPPDIAKNIQELAKNLQVLRDYLQLPIKITSGWRSPAHNAKTKGAAKNSQHIYGKAADIQVPGKSPIEVKKAIETLIDAGKMKQGGIGLYTNWVHYDTRSTKARW
jgi:uncharacterized protein YcbK (DUF882 family)